MSLVPLVLGTTTGVLVLRGCLAVRPAAAPRRPGAGRAAPSGRSPLRAMGRAVLRVGRVADPTPADERYAGAALLLVLLTLPVLPPLSFGLGAGAWLRARLARLRVRRALERAVADGLPEAVDLLLLCCGAGIALPLAHPLVARHLPAPLGPALLTADAATEAGLPRADSLQGELGQLGDRATALAHVLTDHLRYGVALAPSLERLGLELRLDRRRRAEQDARRVPIRLLGPLVTCVLPAFGLLTVVPLLVASLRSLPT